MPVSSIPPGQSSGVNIGGVDEHVGGDAVGRDMVGRDNVGADLVGGDKVFVGRDFAPGDRSHERLVDTLRIELETKNKTIQTLQESNRTLSEKLYQINGAFRIVQMSFNNINLNDYIITSVIFLRAKNLSEEFWNSVPEEARVGDGND
jgi:hypothetical protein